MYMSLSVGDPTSLHLWRAAQQDMRVILRFRAAPSNASLVAEQLLAQSRKNPTSWQYTFNSLGELHAFQGCLTGADISYDGTASSLSISRGSGLRSKKEELGGTRLQVLHHVSKQIPTWEILAYLANGQCMRVQLDANDVFEKSQGKGKFSIRLVEARFSLPTKDDRDEKRGFLCLEDVGQNAGQNNERENITIVFDDEDDRNELAQVLPCSIKQAASMMGTLHLK